MEGPDPKGRGLVAFWISAIDRATRGDSAAEHRATNALHMESDKVSDGPHRQTHVAKEISALCEFARSLPVSYHVNDR